MSLIMMTMTMVVMNYDDNDDDSGLGVRGSQPTSVSCLGSSFRDQLLLFLPAKDNVTILT